PAPANFSTLSLHDALPICIALKQAEATLNKALAEGKQETAATGGKGPAKQEKTGVYKHLLTGVSFMLPMVVAGGLMIALSFVFRSEEHTSELQSRENLVCR